MPNLERVEGRILALSELHRQIQDAFNEFGVQIMSPHFESQPGQREPGLQRTRARAEKPG